MSDARAFPTHILACDPGLITGLALVSTEGPELLYSVEPEVLDVESHVMMMLGTANMLNPGADPLCIIEHFTINAKTAKNSQAPWSLEVTGIVRNALWRERKIEPVFQQPSDMRMWPSERLHALDTWHRGTGLDHANDAIKHCLAAMWARGWRDSRVMV